MMPEMRAPMRTSYGISYVVVSPILEIQVTRRSPFSSSRIPEVSAYVNSSTTSLKVRYSSSGGSCAFLPPEGAERWRPRLRHGSPAPQENRNDEDRV